MRIRARAFLPSTLLLSFVAGPFIPSAPAGNVVHLFGGNVDPPAAGITLPGNVVTGDVLNGSFGYNPLQSGSGGFYNFTGSPGQSISFIVVTPGFSPPFSDLYQNGSYTITVTDAKSGPGATLDIHADTIFTKPNTTTGTAFVDLILNSSTYTGLALPNATTITSFLTSPGTLMWDPDPLGLTATITSFDGQAVPEPSSWLMGIVAVLICTVGFLISRRKLGGDTRSGRHAPLPQP